MTTTPHPLVAKAAQQWVDQAAHHNVAVTLEPMQPTDSGFGAGGIYVRIETGRDWERATVAIYPPTSKGRRVSQSPILIRYRKTRGGRIVWGCDPGATLRGIREGIVWFWHNRPDGAIT